MSELKLTFRGTVEGDTRAINVVRHAREDFELEWSKKTARNTDDWRRLALARSTDTAGQGTGISHGILAGLFDTFDDRDVRVSLTHEGAPVRHRLVRNKSGSYDLERGTETALGKPGWTVVAEIRSDLGTKPASSLTKVALAAILEQAL